MKKLIDDVGELTKKELDRTISLFGNHHSPHEAFAVILQEKNEANENAGMVEKALKEFWIAIMNEDDETQEESLAIIEREAVRAGCGFIQVAAMAQKALKGYSRKDIYDEQNDD